MLKGTVFLCYMIGGAIIPFEVMTYGKITTCKYCEALSKFVIVGDSRHLKKRIFYLDKHISIIFEFLIGTSTVYF